MTESRTGYAGDVDSLLEQVAQRLASDPQFMASLLETHRRQEGISQKAQELLLGVDRLGFLRLALSRRPDGNSGAFRAQAEQIARYTGAQLAPLVQLIRRVDALEGMDMRTVHAQGEGATVVQPLPATGFAAMVAARDRIGESHVDYSPPAPRAVGGDEVDDARPSITAAADASAPRRSEAPHDTASDSPVQPPENPDDSLA